MTSYVDDNNFPKVIFTEGSAPTSPASGHQSFFIDSADHLPKLKNSSGTVTAFGSGSLTTASAQLSADVTMTSANTFYDGPSISLAAGSWIIFACLQFYDGTNAVAQITAKIWDGTTAIVSSGITSQNNSSGEAIPLSYPVTIGSTTTYKVSAACTGTGCLIKAAALNNAAGNTASSIWAIKVG